MNSDMLFSAISKEQQVEQRFHRSFFLFIMYNYFNWPILSYDFFYAHFEDRQGQFNGLFKLIKKR
jgi:hypothetical protein